MVDPFGAAKRMQTSQPAKTPPGTALLQKEVAAEKRQASGKNPSVTPGQIAHAAVGLLGPPKHPTLVAGKPVQGGPVFTPGTLVASVLASAPEQIRHAHDVAVKVAHPSPANPPSLGQNIQGLLSGSFGIPRMGVNEEPKPHPLLSAKPTIQKGLPPTAKTLGEAVTGGLKGARTARAEQETLRATERQARITAYQKALQGNPTAAGAKAARGELAGKYATVRFGGFESFTPEAHDAMVHFISQHPNLGPWDHVRATKALEKIREGTIPQRGEEKLLRHIFGPDVTKQLMTSVSKLRQAKAVAFDVANTPRSLMASGDLSGILRQGLMIATGHPKIWARNIPDYVRAFKSEDVYNAGMEALHQRPNAVNGLYQRMGVDLTELGGRGTAASREEAFRSPIAEKIPGVRMSGRGYTLFLDKARADLADHMYQLAIKNEGKLIPRLETVNGRPQIVRRPLDPNDPHLLQSIGDVVNSSSGRGDLGEGVIGRSQEGLNLLLFSPRLIKSRVDFLNPVWYAKLHPLARHQAYRALGGLVVMTATALGIAKTAGAEVNLDPRSSDFAKIKVGNTRIDLAGGFLQYIRILSQLATQQVVTSGGTKNLGPQGPGKTSDFDVLFRFMRNKLAPLASLTVDVSQQRNTIGQPLTWKNTALARLVPLSGQDAVGIGKDTARATGSTPAGVLAGIGAFGLSGIGGGVQNYQPKLPKSRVKSDTDPFAVSGKSGSVANPFNVP